MCSHSQKWGVSDMESVLLAPLSAFPAAFGIMRNIILLLPWIALQLTASATQIFSPISTADSGAGTLRQAVLTANAVEPEVEVIIDLSLLQTAAGPNNSATINLSSGPLALQRPMSVFGNASALPVIVRSPGSSTRLVEIAATVNGRIELADISFQNGAALNFPSYHGGAIHYEQSSTANILELVIRRCRFFDNQAGVGEPGLAGTTTRGGAIYFGGIANVSNPTLRILDSDFTSNQILASSGTPETARIGGGAAVSVVRSRVEIERTEFSQNTGNMNQQAYGGTVEIISPVAGSFLSGCTMFANDLGRANSAIRVTASTTAPPGSSLEINACLFTDNGFTLPDAPVFVAGLSASPIQVTFNNTTAFDNYGSTRSFLHVGNHATVTLRHCTITRNRHFTSNGAAITAEQSTSTVVFLRSVIARNLSTNGQETAVSPDIRTFNGAGITSGGYNFIGSGVGVPTVFVQTGDSAGASNSEALDPMLVGTLNDYGGPTLSLPPLPDSPLVDAIPLSIPSPLGSDARGTTRPQGNFYDIGAIELPRTPFTTWNLQLPSNQRTADQDPDGDGLQNRMEYFLGGNPQQFTPQPLQFIDSGNQRFVEFTRWSQVRPAYFTQWRVEYSTDMLAWLPLNMVPEVTPATPGSIDYLRYRFSLPSAHDRIFVRLIVQSPN
jgi:hypothetical protein